MRYYWEALFSVEYFPYWEFTMIAILFLNCSALYRLHRIEKKINKKKMDEILDIQDKIAEALNSISEQQTGILNLMTKYIKKS